MRVRAQIARRVAVATAAAAIGVSAAVAVPAVAGTTGQASVQAAAAPTVSITASPTRVAQWQQFALRGKATATPAGSKVVVQRLEGGRWVTFPASSTVTKTGTYSIRVKSGRVGVQKFRVATSKAASKAVSVTVTK